MSKTYYINNAEFLEEIKKCKETGVIHDELAMMFVKLAKRIGTHRSFCGYTYNDDMVHSGILACVEKVHNFDPEKSSNPFGYFSQIIWNVFRQYLNDEKKQYVIRDTILVENGLNPSYKFTERVETIK